MDWFLYEEMSVLKELNLTIYWTLVRPLRFKSNTPKQLLLRRLDAYSEPCQISEMEIMAKIESHCLFLQKTLHQYA